MLRSWRTFGTSILFFLSFSALANAAELAVPHYRHGVDARNCGPCGCLHVVWARHRDIRQTYGTGFDPRNYDQTEPHFYWGPVRAYARYFVDGVGPEGLGEPRCQP
jgi:hypothetical protein